MRSNRTESSTVGAPSPRGAVLVVDDDRAACSILAEALRHRRFATTTASCAAEAMAVLTRHSELDVLLTDLRMPGGGGFELLAQAQALAPTLPVVVITAFGSIQTAVDAIRRGAYDFLTKPYDLDVVALSLDRAVERRRTQVELDRLRAEAAATHGEILGSSPAMARVHAAIARVASADATVLVTGESGTGKELVAHALHEESARRGGPFVPLNCAAVPEALLESELFGHAKGAFTDARAGRVGLFLKADGGTLFLDEIGDMPLAMQAKLLRVIQERRVRPVGADEEVPVDVRVVAATHRDLEAEVAAGRFRQDLLFRIQVIEIALPPLRARGHDVLTLAQGLLARAAARTGQPPPRIDTDVAARLLSYDWPGNVRELQNCMERGLALASDGLLRDVDLPERMRRGPPTDATLEWWSDGVEGVLPLEEIEKRYIQHVLRTVNGNKRVAAQLLRVDRSTLYRRLEHYGERSAPRELDDGS